MLLGAGPDERLSLAMISIRDLEHDIRGRDFRSRKNRVFRSTFEGKDCVVKEYSGESPDGMATEYEVLSACLELRVRAPRLLARVENAIVMEFVEGENVSDAFDRACDASPSSKLSPELEELGKAIAGWMESFHRAFSNRRVRGDAILRNFIMNSSGVVGLDFEESSEDDPIVDLGYVISNVLMTDPQFTDLKVSFAGYLARCYWEISRNDRSSDLPRAVGDGIRHYAKFRSNGDELDKMATLVESGKLALR